MPRLSLCLPLLGLLALAACDEAPTPDVDAPIEPGACGMTLPGVGTWTVAQYTDGFLVDANHEVALRTAGDDMWWYRLDGTGGGPVTLGEPYPRDQRVDLYGTEYVVVRGVTEDFEDRARLIRLADDRVLYDFEWRFEGRGEWIITGNTRRNGVPNPRLRSLRSNKSYALPCALCSFVALDRFGRAWLEGTDGTLIEVQLATGRVTEYPNLFAYRAHMAGAGLSVGRDVERLLFGASSTPVTTCQSDGVIASTGRIACPRANRLDLLDRAGAVIRTVENPGVRWAQEFGAGFIAGDVGTTVWIPSDLDAPVRRFEGRVVASSAKVVIIGDLREQAAIALHSDGRAVPIDETILAVRAISADGTLMFGWRGDDSAVIDLDTGAVVTPVPLGGSWLRFAGQVPLAGGAPLGEAPPADLGNLILPDRACPVMLYEQCVGGECALLLQQFEAPERD